jgi:GTP:adenosylcobinamide-phosphate guanylyltransferase
MNTALKHYVDDMQTYCVASLVHPLVLLEADMFLTVQEDLKNQQNDNINSF